MLEARTLLSAWCVNSLADDNSGGTTDGDGDTIVTLAYAVQQANANSDPQNTITFDPSLTAGGPATIELSGSDLDLDDTNGSLLIVGPTGPNTLTIDAQQQSSVMQIDGGSVELDNLILQNGNADQGGGIINNGWLTLSYCTITSNTTSGNGGGIANNGVLYAYNSTIANNTSGQDGGAIYNNMICTVVDSTLTGNTAVQNGGGLENEGVAELIGTTVSGNSATNGGGIDSPQKITVSACTISGNSAVEGGGISAEQSLFSVTSSTITGNTADEGSALYGAGLAILTCCTVSGNSDPSHEGGVSDAGISDANRLVATGCIIAGNSPFDLANNAATTGTNNLVGDGTGGFSSDPSAGNLLGSSSSMIDPELAPLNNYGGPTQTMPPMPGSPAIGAAGTYQDGFAGVSLATDQRGQEPANGFALDIGAVQDVPIVVSTTDSDPVGSGQVSWQDAYSLRAALGNNPSIATSYSSYSAPGWNEGLWVGFPTSVSEDGEATLSITSGLLQQVTGGDVDWLDANGNPLVTDTNIYPGTNSYPAAGQQQLTADITVYVGGQSIQLPAINIAVVPAAPTDLATTVASSTEIDLAWNDRSSIASEDTIYESTDDGSDFEPIDQVPANAAGVANSYQATGLNPGSEYQFYVAADTDDAESAPVTVAVENTPFVPPTLDVEGNGAVVEGQPYELDLTAEYPDGERGSIDHWTVDWNDGPGGSSNPITYTYPAGADPTQPLVVTHTFAAGIDSPNVTATAVDLANGSFTADPQQVAVIPMATGPLTATVSMGTTVNLAWTNTSSISAGTIVFESTDGTNFDPLYEVDPGVATYSVTGLSPATQYWFEVETDSVNGQSDPSNITPVTTDYPPPTLSVAQQGQAIENQLTLNVQWTATDGAPSTEGISYWLIDWGDGFGQQAYDTQGSGVVQPITRAFSTGQYGAHVTVSAVDGSSPSRTYPALDQEYYLAPQAPTYITANYANSDTELNVRWQDASQIASDYLVQRVKAGLEGGTWATKATIDAHASADYLSIIDVAPEINQSDWGYVYRVVAEAPAGDQNRDSALGEAVVPIPGDNDGSRIVFYNSEGISSDLSGSIGIGSTWSTYIGEMTEIPIQVLDSSGDPEANVTVTVAGFDPTIIQVLDMTDETDSNGQAWIPVEGVGAGTSPLAIADAGNSEAVAMVASSVDPASTVPYSVSIGDSQSLNGLTGFTSSLQVVNPVFNAPNAFAAALNDIFGTVTNTTTDQTFTYPDPQHFQFIPASGDTPGQIIFDPASIPVNGGSGEPSDPYPTMPVPVMQILTFVNIGQPLLKLTAANAFDLSDNQTATAGQPAAAFVVGHQPDGWTTLLLSAQDLSGSPRALIDWTLIGDGGFSDSGNFANGPVTEMVPNGVNNLTLTATEDAISAKIDIYKPDLLVDTNRDGKITSDDEKGKDVWTNSSGALVLPDAAKNDHGQAPDNWAGGDWYVPNQGYVNVPAVTKIGNGDINYLAPLQLDMFNFNGNPPPAGLTVTMSIADAPDENKFFSQIPAYDQVRIFLPSDLQGNNVTYKAGDEEIIGPTKKGSVDFVQNPAGANQEPYSILNGNGVVTFAMQGIEAGATVEITITVTNGNQIVTDKVEVRVSPFVLNDQTENVAATANQQTVFVDHTNQSYTVGNGVSVTNTPVVSALTTAFGNFLAADPGDDYWEQDGYTIGYAQAPGPNGILQLPVVVELPRAFTEGNGQLSKFIEGKILQKDVAVISPFNDPNNSAYSYQQIYGNNGDNSADSGGDIGTLLSPNGGNDAFFHSSAMSPKLVAFFNSQGVNASVGTDASWLLVGHVDEVVSLAPNGKNVDIADPDLAWGLLLWAEKANKNAIMLQGMDHYPNGLSVDDVLNNTNSIGEALNGNQASLEQYNQYYVMKDGNLPKIEQTVETQMQISDPQSSPVAGVNNHGTASLSKGGAFDAFLPSGITSYEIQFTDNIGDYQLLYKFPGQAGYTVDNADGNGNISKDEVFPQAKTYILAYWWKGVAAQGDTFTYAADTSAGIVELPVLFYDDQNPQDELNRNDHASEYTTDFVNSFFNGDTVYTGTAWGPSVDYLGTGNAADIVQDYATAAFKQLDGISNVVNIDGRFYHDQDGFLHCATNAIRSIPASAWWTKQK